MPEEIFVPDFERPAADEPVAGAGAAAPDGASAVYELGGETVEERREAARARLAFLLLGAVWTLIFLTILIGAGLIYVMPIDRFSTDDFLNLILAVGSIFSGLLGAAITFYFSAK